uniref:Gfo/Idh/MocA family protein n=1 Tax=Acinetobacter sp. TUM15521 TaxID=2609156 RepID=UPI00125054E1
KKGFDIIKEKPLDYSYLNAKKLEDISIKYNKKIFTLCQRIYDPIFSEFIRKINLIGKPYALQYDYFLSHNKTVGWRSKKELACGGVLLDMGYHIIDTINSFFGEIIETNSYSAFSNEETKKEILEDYTTISFKNRREVIGTINIGRNFHKKKEYITVFCDQGVAEISPKKGFSIYNNNGQEVYKLEVHVKNEEVTRNQIQDFLNIINFKDEYSYRKHLNRHLLNVETIDKIYSKQQINFINSI